MSDNTQNPNPTPNAGNQGTSGTNGNANANAPAKKDNFIVAGFKRAKEAVSNGWKEVKSHPVTHGICAALGIVGGGAIVYTAMNAVNANASIPEPPSIPQIPEPEKEEEPQTGNPVEYVEIPNETPATEEQ